MQHGLPHISRTQTTSHACAGTNKSPIRQLIHDLRNPLTSLQLGLETLAEELVREDDRAIVEILRKDVERLRAMLDVASEVAKSQEEGPDRSG